MPPNVFRVPIRTFDHSSSRRANLRVMAGGLASVVPTFRPTDTTETLVKILASSGPTVVSDDASPCTSDRRLTSIGKIPNVTLVRNTLNCGIGRALNQGLKYARSRKLTWLLTVDQDSHIDEHYASSMVDYANSLIESGVNVGAIGAGQVLDASGPLTYPTRSLNIGGESVVSTEEVVQSGTLWSVPALETVGGFDESLGMDAVDAAACLGLRVADFMVIINPVAVLRHEIEDAQQIRLLGRTVMVTGHSKQRRTAIVRNRLRLFPREFRKSPTHAVRTLRRSIVNVVALPLRHKT